MRFQVLCIRKEEWLKSCAEEGRPSPEYLGIYTVTKMKVTLDGKDRAGEYGVPGLYYQLAEMHHNSGFHSKEFVALPTSTADEMEEEVKEAIIM